MTQPKMERILLLLSVAVLIGCLNVLANDINGCFTTSTITCKNTRSSDQQNSPCQYFMREFHSIQKPAGTLCNATSKSHVLNGLTKINGAFYYFHTNVNDKKNWHEASDYCRSRGMELVTIETEAENNALIKKVNELLENEEPSFDSYFWIGLNDLGKEGEYRWTLTGTVADYTFWNPGDPNNNGLDGKPEHCVDIWKISTGTAWNDWGCTNKGRFICQV
ncbi:hypothetical protein B566_EDAN007819 [Ephemera danica]|nr:hypothetical protein B566_EDAN007819 [Ephemera danica]